MIGNLQPAATFTRRENTPNIARMLPIVLTVGGTIGLAAAFLLTVERLNLAADPDYIPSCSINPVLSCGSIMKSDQAALFGFPNSLLGIFAFAVVTTTGTALWAGARFRPWFWHGLLAGSLAGVILVHWLIFQSLYRIQALCPYCMAVWAVTIPIFWYVTLHLISSAPTQSPGRSLITTAIKFHSTVPMLWGFAVLVLIIQRFWSYWATLL
ncbi:vitamin K epoxide reductase family protein [Acrocarpospora macrocephala]|uniref:Membrane protein n=1 Tax=Acrocarpospora macrocephala TaxID=150177 RepID=A0A5M3WKL5_9ACTN|nr:vitamin K epoxide reductase family protein [Acrocarpospora macrocephala]GES08719.1 membrane protein [Acrocarpospora macrocephala]